MIRRKRLGMYRVAVYIEGEAFYDVRAQSAEAAEALAMEQARFSDVTAPTLTLSGTEKITDSDNSDILEEV